MPFARPSFDELVARISGDMRSQLLAQGKRADPLLRRSKMWVLARVYAAIWHVAYGLIEWLSLQILPSTATDIEYLREHAKTYRVDELAATKASGVVHFTGDNGSIIPVDTPFVRDDGVTYLTTAGGTVSGGVLDLAAQAEEAGDEGNMDAGTALALSSPITGVDSTVTWVSGFDTGTDAEEKEELRERILVRTGTTPHGGARDDYDIWAREVNGVFRVLVIPLGRGPGTVDVYFLHEEGTGIGIPTSGQIEDVQDHIDESYVRPVGPGEGGVLALAPEEVEVDFEFDSLDPDTPEVHAAIEAELDALFLRKALIDSTIAPSDFYDAIEGAAGVNGFDLATPSGTETAELGEVLVRGDITWPS